MTARTLTLALTFATLASAAAALEPLTEVSDGVPEGAQILDIRSAADFATGHLRGARNVPYPTFRGPGENPGRVPDAAALEGALEAAGLSPDAPVLIVYAGNTVTDFGGAARVYWSLKSAGFAELSILNGGMASWRAADLPIAKAAAPVAPTDITVSYDQSWWVDADGVQDIVLGRAPGVLIDARPADFFEGRRKHGAAQEAGTLAGALNIVHASWFGAQGGEIAPDPAMLDRLRAVAAEAGAPLVSFCNTGHWAATNWFVASELAGIPDVKLYPESMVGWTLLARTVTVGE
ncbi:MAG: rhodanese-like domain-containing protein [Pseudomonadota bacterium]